MHTHSQIEACYGSPKRTFFNKTVVEINLSLTVEGQEVDWVDSPRTRPLYDDVAQLVTLVRTPNYAVSNFVDINDGDSTPGVCFKKQ